MRNRGRGDEYLRQVARASSPYGIAAKIAVPPLTARMAVLRGAAKRAAPRGATKMAMRPEVRSPEPVHRSAFPPGRAANFGRAAGVMSLSSGFICPRYSADRRRANGKCPHSTDDSGGHKEYPYFVRRNSLSHNTLCASIASTTASIVGNRSGQGPGVRGWWLVVRIWTQITSVPILGSGWHVPEPPAKGVAERGRSHALRRGLRDVPPKQEVISSQILSRWCSVLNDAFWPLIADPWPT